MLEHVPGGQRLYRLNHRIKSGVKRAIGAHQSRPVHRQYHVEPLERYIVEQHVKSPLQKAGTDVTLVAYGTLADEVLTAAELLEEKGVSAEAVKLNRIAPLDVEPVQRSRPDTAPSCRESG